MFNRNSKCEYTYIFPKLRGGDFHSFTIKYDVSCEFFGFFWFFQIHFIELRMFPILLCAFIMLQCWILSNVIFVFALSIIFVLQSIFVIFFVQLLSPVQLFCNSSVYRISQVDIGVGCYFLLQGIFPTQGLNTCLLHCLANSTSEPPEKSIFVVYHVN